MNRTALLSGAAAAALALGAGGANAQTPTVQIDQLQQQIQQLQQQLESLRTQVNTQAQQQQRAAAAPVPATPPGPHAVQTAGNRFGVESADKQYSLYLTGRLHFDIGDYVNYHQDSSKTAPTSLESGANARRARLGVVGKFAGDWNYTFIYDFGGSTDTGANGFNGGGIENAYLTYNGLHKGPVPLAFDLGYQDVPFTLDEATSSNDIMFMERSSSQVIATNFGAGDNRSAFGIRSNSDRYWAGVYVTGPVAGSAHTVAAGGEQYGTFGRLTYQVLQGPDYSLHLGVDALGALHETGATRTLALTDRPELRIDSTSLVGATIGTAANPVSSGAVYGAEAAAGYQSLFFQGEYFHYDVNLVGLPSYTFNGGYAEASWTLTGEHRKYNPGSGAYSGINPDHPFSISAGTWGAFELGARYSVIDLDDQLSTKAPFLGGQSTVYTVGLNWYLNPNMRFMFDYLHGIVKKNSGAATLGETGASFDAIAMRTQVAF
jgi:phosphate-selective porin OprO/OprP